MEQICANAGIILVFLPPYSSDFNPIERAFAQLKQWIKKNWRLCEEVPMEDFLRLGMTALKNQAAEHFYSCGIGRDPEEEWVDEDDVLAGPVEEENTLD